MINQHHDRALYRSVVHHAENGQILEPSGICCRAFSSASNQTRKKPSRAQDFSTLAKFANLGKGQGIPRPVGIGSGMGVGMAGKPTARGCGVPREPTSDSCSLPPCLPVEPVPVPVPVQSSPIPSSVPGLMIPLPRGPLVFPQPSSMRCQIAQPGCRQVKGRASLWNLGPGSPGHRNQSSLLREKTRHATLGV